MASTLPELVTEAFIYFRTFPPTTAAAMALEAHPQGRARMATLLSESGAFEGHYVRVDSQQELLQRAEALYAVWDSYLTQILPVGWDTRPAEEAQKLEAAVHDVRVLHGYLSDRSQVDVAQLPVSLILLIQKTPEHLRKEVVATALEALRMTWGNRVNDWIYLNAGEASSGLSLIPTGGTTYLDQVRFGQGGLFGAPVPPRINVVNSLMSPDDSALTSGDSAEDDAREVLTLLRDATTREYLAAEYPLAVRVLARAAVVTLSGGEVECYYQARPVGDFEDHENTKCTSLVLITNLYGLPDLLVETYQVSLDEIDRDCLRFSVITGAARQTRDERRSRRVVDDPRTKRSRMEEFWVKVTYIAPRSIEKSGLIPWEDPDKFSSVELICQYITELAERAQRQPFSEPGLHYDHMAQIAWAECVQAGTVPTFTEINDAYTSTARQIEIARAAELVSVWGADIGPWLVVEQASAGVWHGWAVVGYVQGTGTAVDPHMLVASPNPKRGGSQKKASKIILALVDVRETQEDLPFGARFEEWTVLHPDRSLEGQFLWYSLLSGEVSRMTLAELLYRVVSKSLQDRGLSV